MDRSLSVGWSCKDITPHGRTVSLSGQFYERIATEVDCGLSVTALAIDNGDTSFSWVSCDIAMVSSVLSEDVRVEMRKRAPNIDATHIFLSATHTHTAPYIKSEALPGLDFRFEAAEGVTTPEEFHEYLVQKIVDALIEANTGKIPGCTVQTGVSPVATGCCRRGIVDSGEAVMYIDVSRDDFVRMESANGGPINLMYVRDVDGNLKGAVTCIPCTAQILEHQFYVSSDYVGRLRNLLRGEYGDDFFLLPLISAAGDCSPRNLVTKDYGLANMYDKDGADAMARRVFDAVTAEAERPVDTVSDPSELRVGIKRINLPAWIPSEDDYTQALALRPTDKIVYDINDYVQKGVEPYFHTPLALEKQVKAIIARYENKEAYANIETQICAVRFGNTVWVSNPFELFQDLGSRMIASSKAGSLWSIELTYDALGYFPTAEAAAAGGYGATISSVRVDPTEAGDILVRESVELADSLFSW